MGGLQVASEIPLLSSFLYLFGEAGAGPRGPSSGAKRPAASGVPGATRSEDSVRRGV